MADVTRPISVAGAGTSSRHRQPSRLQRRAPSSLQISPVSDWNVAIPLLSPLASPSSSPPPPPPPQLDRTADAKSRCDADSDGKPPVLAFKKWQHPAAPFCYEAPPPLARPFVPAQI